MVTTEMTAQRDSPWHGGIRAAVGRSLLRSGDDDHGLTAAEIAEIAGKDQSNVKKVADELLAAGILREASLAQQNGRVGRPPGAAYAFADGERERFESYAEEQISPGGVRVGTHVVFVERDQMKDRLSDVLSVPVVARGIEEAWEIEGDGFSGLLFPFNGSDAPEASGNFLSQLRDAQVKAGKGVMTRISRGRELRDAERRRRRLLERTRVELGETQERPASEPSE